MILEMDIDGIIVKLYIHGYEPNADDNSIYPWCKCGFMFQSGDWLNYHSTNAEILLSSEIDVLEHALNKLLSDEPSQIKKVRFVEPDFTFMLPPKYNLLNNPNIIFRCEGDTIQDVYAEWRITFWQPNGLTANYLTLTLGRSEITQLRNYLSSITNNV